MKPYRVGGGAWHGAAYYSLCAYKYLPKDMDRILYIDAGDVLIIGDIDKYYFDDFEDKMLIVTGIRYKLLNNKAALYNPRDLFYDKFFKDIARGLFNSGSYVINLNKMRQQNYDIKDYFICAKILYHSRGKNSNIYFGDQGFLSLMFVGNIKIFGYPEIINLWHMPYNFCMWYFDKMIKNPDYKFYVIHFANNFKPWLGKYPIFLKRFQAEDMLHNLDDLKLGQAQYYYMWHEYAIMANDRLNACNISDL
ncbi:MAG: hypothetical protein IJ797_08525 [Selenomonadaceae bacterium]|nr:hypothetical protein [Selenomonadaceae bacterium]